MEAEESPDKKLPNGRRVGGLPTIVELRNQGVDITAIDPKDPKFKELAAAGMSGTDEALAALQQEITVRIQVNQVSLDNHLQNEDLRTRLPEPFRLVVVGAQEEEAQVLRVQGEAKQQLRGTVNRLALRSPVNAPVAKAEPGELPPFLRKRFVKSS